MGKKWIWGLGRTLERQRLKRQNSPKEEKDPGMLCIPENELSLHVTSTSPSPLNPVLANLKGITLGPGEG